MNVESGDPDPRNLIKVGAPIMRWRCCPPHSAPRNGLDFREGIDYACANTKRKGYDMFLTIGKEMIDAEVTDVTGGAAAGAGGGAARAVAAPVLSAGGPTGAWVGS